MGFLERKRQAELIAREADGESLWRYDFPIEFRRKVLYLMIECSAGYDIVFEHARYLTLKSEGWLDLGQPRATPKNDFVYFIEKSEADLLLEGLERFFETLSNYSVQSKTSIYGKAAIYSEELRSLLLSDRINWDFINGMMIPRDSQIMHAQLIEPTLRLLHDSKYADVESVIQKGLKEISIGDAGDAITDFGTAAQTFLRTLGAEGKTLRDQKSSGIQRGLLTHSQGKIVDAIAMYRNEGEAHIPETYTLKDAWLVCHLVCALISRLA